MHIKKKNMTQFLNGKHLWLIFMNHPQLLCQISNFHQKSLKTQTGPSKRTKIGDAKAGIMINKVGLRPLYSDIICLHLISLFFAVFLTIQLYTTNNTETKAVWLKIYESYIHKIWFCCCFVVQTNDFSCCHDASSQMAFTAALLFALHFCL